MTSTLLNSPGRGPSGKLRNFKAMSSEKLDGVIADLEAYGDDPEALEEAMRTAGREPSKAKPKPKPKRTTTSKKNQDGTWPRSDEPLGIIPSKIRMKAKEIESLASVTRGHDCVMEPKLDGHRVLVHRSNAGVKVYASSGVSKTHLAPHIAEQLEYLPPGTWLDGEGITGEGKGAGAVSNDWGGTQSILGAGSLVPHHRDLIFAVFDLLAYDGTNACPVPLSERREMLTEVVTEGLDNVIVLPTFEATELVHKRLVKQGYEGTIIKWTDAPYLCGKTGASWWKWKAVTTEDVIVLGFEPGKGSFSGLIGAIQFGQVKDGKLVERGTCSGMTMEIRRHMSQHPADWVGQVIEIEHQGSMGGSGKLRHPQFKRLRTDKDPTECIWT